MQYVGSKASISKDICFILNTLIRKNNITEYYEPFVGGANVIDGISCDNRYGFDANPYLIALWKRLQTGWNPLDDYPEFTYEEFMDMKQNPDAFPPEAVALAGLFCTHKNIWFSGFAPISISMSNFSDKYYSAVVSTLKQVPRIKSVHFDCCDYQKMHPAPHNALIYCDPPYYNTLEYPFKIDHDEFWQWVRDVSKDNIVIVSEYRAPYDFNLLREIHTSSRMAGGKPTIECLFSPTLTANDIDF